MKKKTKKVIFRFTAVSAAIATVMGVIVKGIWDTSKYGSLENEERLNKK